MWVCTLRERDEKGEEDGRLKNNIYIYIRVESGINNLLKCNSLNRKKCVLSS